MEKRSSISSKLQKVDQDRSEKLLQSSASYIQMENTKATCLFLRGVEFCPSFDIQVSITLAIFWEKSHNYTIRNAPTFISIEPPITK